MKTLIFSKIAGKICKFAIGLTPFFLIFYSNGQTEGNWDLQGNFADSTTFIGTKNASCLRFSSNNEERMRISPIGNVGIGKTNPTERLDIEGNIMLTNDIIFKGYQDAMDTSTRFLMIKKDGTTHPLNINTLKAFMSYEDCYPTLMDMIGDGIPEGNNIGSATLSSWASRVQGQKSIIYTGVTCPAWVGIGTDLPKVRFDVKGAGRFTRGLKIGQNHQGGDVALYIENHITNSNPHFDHLILVKNSEGKKVLQLDEEGLLRSREVKVDLETWPDYVFKEDYQLMPLNDVKIFIEKNGHLPNVPSATEIEENGVNLGEASKISMEKIEELTLYLLELNERMEKQEEQLKSQNSLIEAQEETIKLQQQLINQLQETNK